MSPRSTVSSNPAANGRKSDKTGTDDDDYEQRLNTKFEMFLDVSLKLGNQMSNLTEQMSSLTVQMSSLAGEMSNLTDKISDLTGQIAVLADVLQKNQA